MSNQRLRIYAALVLAVVALFAVLILDLRGVAVSDFYGYVAVGAMTFLFGVTTNGSGIK